MGEGRVRSAPPPPSYRITKTLPMFCDSGEGGEVGESIKNIQRGCEMGMSLTFKYIKMVFNVNCKYKFTYCLIKENNRPILCLVRFKTIFLYHYPKWLFLAIYIKSKSNTCNVQPDFWVAMNSCLITFVFCLSYWTVSGISTNVKNALSYKVWYMHHTKEPQTVLEFSYRTAFDIYPI